MEIMQIPAARVHVMFEPIGHALGRRRYALTVGQSHDTHPDPDSI